MRRFGNAEELIGATLLFASEKAGSFIRGSNLLIDGGFSVPSIERQWEEKDAGLDHHNVIRGYTRGPS
jgi:hypothetical protein